MGAFAMKLIGVYQTSILDLSHFSGYLMGVCDCIIIGVGNHRVMYGL